MKPLRLYISADLEGVCGITSTHQVYPAKDEPQTDYLWALRQLSREISALIQPAQADARVGQVVVNDAHARMTNIWPDHWPHGQEREKVQLLSGKPKPMAMVAGLDETFDAALFIGYHAKAGSEKGVLVHSFNESIANIELNGISVGELGMNACYAWNGLGIPVLLASGDSALEKEALSLFGQSSAFVRTKTGISFGAALCRPEVEVYQELKQVMMRILDDYTSMKAKFSLPAALNSPYTLKVTFANTLYADIVGIVPAITRLDGTSVEVKAKSIQTIYAWLQTLYCMTAYDSTL